jgi:hypothetical protein
MDAWLAELVLVAQMFCSLPQGLHMRLADGLSNRETIGFCLSALKPGSDMGFCLARDKLTTVDATAESH